MGQAPASTRSGKGRTPAASGAGRSQLGERLREERDRRGLSLRELARRCEVSPSLVSQIETGKIQPSVRTLYAIVSELGVSLDAVFAPPAKQQDAALEPSEAPSAAAAELPSSEANGRVQRAHDRRVIELESSVRWERLTTWNDRDVEFLYAIYDVGGASSPDGALVRHNGREFGTVISGTLDLVRVEHSPSPAQRRRRGRAGDLGRRRPVPPSSQRSVDVDTPERHT